jgi:hypothetical protein
MILNVPHVSFHCFKYSSFLGKLDVGLERFTLCSIVSRINQEGSKMVEFAAIAAAAILVVLIIFQGALAAGVGLGRYAWGGQSDVLTTGMRVASVVSLLVYAASALVILDKAGVMEVFDNNDNVNAAMAVATGLLYLGIVMNFVSRSDDERRIMTPVASVLALLFLYVTLAA